MPVDKFGRMSDTKTKDTGVSLTYINNNYVRSDGETPLTGSLNMRGNTIYNVADPVNPQDVVTKVYVDNTKGSGVIGRKTKDGVSIKENMDFLGKQKIKNLPEPVDEKDAATKEYVDDKTKNLFIDKNDNIAFGLNVDMEGNKIFSLPEPEQDHEPATKKYVDDLQTHYIDKRGNVRFDRNINVGNNRIFALKDPKKDYEATNKKYVDDSITKRLQEEKDNFLPQDPATKEYVDEAIKQVAGGDILVSKEGVFIKANGHYRATAPLDIDNHKMENLREPLEDGDAVNKKYVDGIVEDLTLKQGLIRENGGFNLVDSYINMNFNNIRNLGYPKNEADAVPRKFVQDVVKEVSPFLKENGNYQTSTSIDMKFNKLFNLQKPTEPYDAVTKDYVDYITKEIKEKQIIAVHARYCGPLEKGDYPFKFGGNSLENCEIKINKEIKGLISGFVMPHPGYIKKTICEGVAYINLNTAAEDIINSLNENDINRLKLHYEKESLRKEDFKKKFSNELKHILRFNVYSDEPKPNKQNSFFEIIKIEKKYHNFLPLGSYKPDEFERLQNLPRVIKTVLIQKFNLIQVEVSREEIKEIYEVSLVMQISNNDKVRLEEGETLNIRISNFPDDLFLDSFDIPTNVFKPAVMVLFSKLNFNFTFLIELDPL